MESEARMYSTKKMVENILYLIQRKQLEIGEVEAQAGKSPGYLLTLRKETEEIIPPIDVACQFARILGVSVDELIYGDFNYVPNNLLFFEKFLLELRDRTSRGEMPWEYISTLDVDSAMRGYRSDILIVEKIRDDYTDCEEPAKIVDAEGKLPAILQKSRLYEQMFSRHHCFIGNYRVRSWYMPTYTVYADRSAIRCRFESDTRISIYSMRFEMTPGQEQNVLRGGHFFEIYLEKRELKPGFDRMGEKVPEEDNYIWVSQPVCCTTVNAMSLYMTVGLLYEEVVKSENDLRFDPYMKKVMQSFVGGVSNN